MPIKNQIIAHNIDLRARVKKDIGFEILNIGFEIFDIETASVLTQGTMIPVGGGDVYGPRDFYYHWDSPPLALSKAVDKLVIAIKFVDLELVPIEGTSTFSYLKIGDSDVAKIPMIVSK